MIDPQNDYKQKFRDNNAAHSMKPTKRWKLNADVGEGCDDAQIMPLLDCANVCCGAHAGSETITQATIALADKHNVTVGAHPGYADRDNFGRFSLSLSDAALRETLYEQITLMQRLCPTMAYIKPHGALNHDMLADERIFSTICAVVAKIDTNLALMIPTNANQAQQTTTATEYGLNIWWEVFADRAYEPSGLPRSRQFDDAVHQDPQTIVEQIQRIQNSGEIIAVNGSILDVSVAQTICVHGDNAASIEAIQQLST